MVTWLSDVLAAVSLAVAVWGLVLAARKRSVAIKRRENYVLLWALGALEIGLLAQAIVGLASLAGTDRQIEGLTFAIYLLVALLVLPAGLFWAMAEPGRWGPAVLTLAGVAVAVMILRMHQLWTVPSA